jgi:predicted phosphodiesterase
MKIALFSDVHANLPALEAVLADIDRHRPDAIYCLGDLVGYNVWPNEVINLLRQRNISSVAGNYDFSIGRNHHDCGCNYRDPEKIEMGNQSVAYTNRVIGASERDWLRALPTQLRLSFELADPNPARYWEQQSPLTLLLVHGSPRRINEGTYSDPRLGRVLETANTDILATAHTHRAFYERLETGSADAPYFRHAINTGSVGKPVDGDPRAGYVLLTIDETARPGHKNGVSVEIIRVEYDVERAAKAIESSDLPKPYANILRKGGLMLI